MLNNTALTALTRIIGPQNLLTHPDALDRYTGDALAPSRAFGAETAFNRLPDAIALPANTQEVAQIVAWANQSRTPLIPYGGGTGVMGAVLPHHGGIIIDTKRMNRILAIDHAALTAQVQAGLILGDLETQLAPHNLMLGHDPYSVPIATIAGAISTNGVGYRACAHGPMGDQVIGLQAVLPNAQIIETRDIPKYSAGPNLNHLLIGAEGAFGIITRATLRLHPTPEAAQFAATAFPDFEHGFHAASQILALGIRPALLDLTQEENETTLHLLFEGFTEGVTAQAQRAASICQTHQGQPLGPEPTQQYWQNRRDSALAYQANALGQPRQTRWNRWRRPRGFDYLHLALPASRVLEYRRRATQILQTENIAILEHAIWSRPELYSMLIAPQTGHPAEARQRLARSVDRVLKLAQDMGGAMEYCHGVGIKLNHLLPREQGPTHHQTIRQLKQTLDPNNIMNPGKLAL